MCAYIDSVQFLVLPPCFVCACVWYRQPLFHHATTLNQRRIVCVHVRVLIAVCVYMHGMI